MRTTTHSSIFTLYPANPRGNEPEIHFEEKNKIQGFFVYIGTGALANLKYIRELIGTPSDDETQLPKIYILDNSQYVQSFWEYIKKIAAKAETFDEFQIETLFNSRNFAAVCFPQIKNISNEIINVMESLITGSDEWYPYFRKIIGNLTFIRHDWDNAYVFETLKNRTPETPFVVYASNIVEFVATNYGDYSEGKFQQIIRNIQSLNPAFVIHTRTSMDGIAAHATLQGWSIGPDRSIILDKAQAAGPEHLNALQDPSYIDLYTRPTPINVAYHRVKSTCSMQ